MDFSRERFDTMARDIREARAQVQALTHELWEAKNRSAQIWSVVCFFAALFIVYVAKWPWYVEVPVFLAVYFAGVAWLTRWATGFSEHELKYPDPIEYERDAW